MWSKGNWWNTFYVRVLHFRTYIIGDRTFDDMDMVSNVPQFSAGIGKMSTELLYKLDKLKAHIKGIGPIYPEFRMTREWKHTD